MRLSFSFSPIKTFKNLVCCANRKRPQAAQKSDCLIRRERGVSLISGTAPSCLRMGKEKAMNVLQLSAVAGEAIAPVVVRAGKPVRRTFHRIREVRVQQGISL